MCHVKGEKKDVRNDYGKLFIKVMDKPTLTEDWKALAGDEKKTYEADVMTPAFEGAYNKLSKMTFADLINHNMIEGVKGPVEEMKEGDATAKEEGSDKK